MLLTTSQPPAQTVSANIPPNKFFTPFALLTALVILHVGLLLLGTLRSYQHLHLLLLCLQYAVILPVLLWFLRSASGSSTGGYLPGIDLKIALIGFVLVAIPLSWRSTQGLLNPDESGYSFQARLYRSGRIMADPLIGATTDVRQTRAELFYENHILLPRGWFPKFPPGWPLVLSLGYFICARWLLNPIFGVAQLLAIAAIGKRIFSPAIAVVAVFLGILSPFFLVNSIGMMSHALCALLSAAACLALFGAFRTGNLWYYAGMFSALAFTLQVRPYTGFVLSLVLTMAAFWLNRDNRPALAKVFLIGLFFGVIAFACVLLYNHVYTGNWFVSPYALAAGADTPPELSFSQSRIWHGIRQYGTQAIEESLIGAFPFTFLLVGYTLLREKNRRKEIWILASIYLALILAYLAHPDGSGVFFGERFHFEGFFAVLLLAARGWQLLVEHWRIPRRAQVCAMLLFATMQVGQQGATVVTVARRFEPYRKVREAINSSGVKGLVLLHDSPGFVAKHFNLNDADWRHASRIYLIDAEPDRRNEWACRYGVASWTAVSYDPQSKRAVLLRGNAACQSDTRPQ